ncbi:efflux transporter periplasmic adaptor subunit [Pandoraea faecigallinarum]|uniref:Efflux transporter periplasmic adaptor subunit n=1 Tax=Pandoraea faecigallinarum TaxID=656179 RepID=A0A0H3WTH7_9BURK|nr:efflux RND transporter periplasmic adaptor subunit [Pandoraea faecigallinarum]AKM31052.1 efflux transporter periplasmic adaptor subunit [Pandoraea faecigallinarum]
MPRAKTKFAIGAVVVLCIGAGVTFMRAERSGASTQSRPPVVDAAARTNHDGHVDTEKGNAKADVPGRPHDEAQNEAHDEAGIVSMTPAQVSAAGIDVKPAGMARIAEQMELPGEIRFNEDRTGHIVPRVSGVIERVNVSLGQQVKRGEVLAVISSTQVSEQRAELLTAQERRAVAWKTFEREKSLWEEKISAEQDFIQAQQALREADIAVRNASQKLGAVGADKGSAGAMSRLELRAPFDGTVLEKHATQGELVADTANLFTISDLSTVWAEIAVPAQSLGVVRVGTPVTVGATAFDSQAKGTVAYVGSLLGEQTRTATARVTLQNPDRVWRPGVFVNVVVGTNEARVPVAVSADALQNVQGRTVVFVRTADGFRATPVETGRRDGEFVEIVNGLPANTPYAAANSFILKAELGKSTAEHGH